MNKGNKDFQKIKASNVQPMIDKLDKYITRMNQTPFTMRPQNWAEKLNEAIVEKAQLEEDYARYKQSKAEKDLPKVKANTLRLENIALTLAKTLIAIWIISAIYIILFV